MKLTKSQKNAFLVYRLFELPKFGITSVTRVVHKLFSGGLDLVSLLESDDSEIEKVRKSLFSADQLEELLRPSPELEEKLSDLLNNECQFFTIWDQDYPRQLLSLLGSEAPPVLTTLGDMSLLKKAGLGFCGSRKASEKGLEVTRDIAEQISERGYLVISGYANGVDEAAHTAALKAGGQTVMVLAEGMSHFRIKKSYKDVWKKSNALVISEFPPGVPWRVQSAMQRNRTIIALSMIMIVIEAGARGGTMSAGLDALRMNRPLFVPLYEVDNETTSGNRILLSKGADLLLKNKNTNRANLSSIFRQLGGDFLESATVQNSLTL